MREPELRLVPLSGSLLITFRELRSTHVAIGLLAVTTIGWLMLAFAMNLDVVEGSVAALRIFGLDMTPDHVQRDAATGERIRSAVTLEQFAIGIQQFVSGAAYMLGTLLGLFAAVPVTAATLEPGRIDLLLSKPVGRKRLLAGHVFGILLVVFVMALYLVVAIWIVLWIKTGIRVDGILWAVPVITAMFAVMYGAALAMLVQGAAAPLALILTYGLVFFSLILALRDQVTLQLGSVARAVYLGLYHVLPNFIEGLIVLTQLAGPDEVTSWYPLISSFTFGAACYAWAAFRFTRRDF